MRKIFLLLLVFGILHARPICDVHQYHDFVWASDYSAPIRPPDTILDNCLNTGVDPAICNSFANPNLTESDKRQLVLAGLVNTSAFPDFGAAENWNQNSPYTKYAPDGVATRSSTNIRDAWNKIVAIYPSLYGKDGSLLVNSTGQVDSRHGFSFVVQKETFSSDCATSYEICGYDVQVSDAFGSPSTSVLGISTQYLIHHSLWVQHCYTSNGVTYCYTSCDYVYSDDRRDSMTLADTQSDNYQSPNFTAFSFIDSMNGRLVDGWLDVALPVESNFAMFRIGNSTIKFKQSGYALSSNYTPYNAITPQANQPPNSIEFYGLALLSRERNTSNSTRFERIHFLAPAEALNCSFDFYGHFSHIRMGDFCHLDNQTPTISLLMGSRTNSTITIGVRFYDNQTGNPLVSKNISLSHGNQTLFVVTDQNGRATASFAFNPNSPIVSADFQTDFITKSAKAQLTIPVDFPYTLDYLFYLAALLLTFYLLYKYARRAVNLEN